MESKIVTGYQRGQSFPLLVVEFQPGLYAESATAAAFLEMAEAAKLDGVNLVITCAFRSFDEQQKLWAERSDPTVRAQKGVAAKPGWSNHQSGRALDIKTGLTVSDFKTGLTSTPYRWLEKNAKRFGFVRTVPSEPWHWEHTTTESRPEAA